MKTRPLGLLAKKRPSFSMLSKIECAISLDIPFKVNRIKIVGVSYSL